MGLVAVAGYPRFVTHPAVRDGALHAEPPGIGGYRAVALPPVFDGRRAALRAPPPAIGEHTDAILDELGRAEEELRRLRKAGIVA